MLTTPLPAVSPCPPLYDRMLCVKYSAVVVTFLWALMNSTFLGLNSLPLVLIN